MSKASIAARRRLLEDLAGPLGTITVTRKETDGVEYLVVRSTGTVIGPTTFDGFPVLYERTATPVVRPETVS